MNKPLSFTNITPPGDAMRQTDPDAGFAVTSYLGAVYIADITCGHGPGPSAEDRRVLVYSPETGDWITVYSDRSFSEWEYTSPSRESRSEFRIIASPETGRDRMLIRFISRSGVQYLESGDGKHFTVERLEHPEETGAGLGRYFAFRQLLIHGDYLFGVPADGGGIALNVLLRCPYGHNEATWSEANWPGFGQTDNRAISASIPFGGALYAAAANAKQGFEIWRQGDANTPDSRERWGSVLIKGAYRYADNTEVLSMAVFKDALYIVAGSPLAGQTSAAGFGGYKGFEVIRLYRDGQWELLVGTLRITPNGLQVPLSGLGPGLDRQYRTELLSFTATEQSLFLVTWNQEGLRLWMSGDGEEWTTVQRAGFEDFHRVERCLALPAGNAIGLAFDITNLDGKREKQLWFGEAHE